MHNVYLLLGSNEGNCLAQIIRAVAETERHVGNAIKKSSIYKTEPWGFESENFFLNQVILIETEFSPITVLEKILNIESMLGRKRTQNGYESRTIDIDILFYDNIIINTEKLKVPHPMIANRRFTLIPLNEIATNFQHPVNQISIAEMLKHCDDTSEVIKYQIENKLKYNFSK